MCCLFDAVLFCRFLLSLTLLSEMAAKYDSRLDKPLLKPSVTNDNQGCFIYVSCCSCTARFYLDKLDESKRSLGKCILLEGSWYTPSEYLNPIVGKWKQLIMHSGKPLSEYSLSCLPKQGGKHASGNVDTQPNCGSTTRS